MSRKLQTRWAHVLNCHRNAKRTLVSYCYYRQAFSGSAEQDCLVNRPVRPNEYCAGSYRWRLRQILSSFNFFVLLGRNLQCCKTLPLSSYFCSFLRWLSQIDLRRAWHFKSLGAMLLKCQTQIMHACGRLERSNPVGMSWSAECHFPQGPFSLSTNKLAFCLRGSTEV